MSFNIRGAWNRRSYDHLPSWLAAILRFSEKNAYYCLAPAFIITFFFLIAEAGLLNSLENLTVNLRFRARAPYDPPASQKLILVGIDEESLKIAGAWPWRRSVHGDFLQLLSAAKVSVVGMDILFTEPSDSPEADAALAKGMDKMKFAVVTCAASNPLPEGSQNSTKKEDLGLSKPLTNILGDQTQITTCNNANFPIELVRPRSYLGFADSIATGSDGIRRTLPMIVRIKNDVWPSLVTQTLLLYWKIPPDQLVIKLGKYIEFPTPEGPRRVPINSKGEIAINFRDENSFVFLGYMGLCRTMVDTYIKGLPWPDYLPKLEGRIILSSEVATGLSDMGPNPLEKHSPLVFVHLNVINSILKNDYLIIVPNIYFFGMWLIIGYFTLFSLRQAHAFLAVSIPTLIVGLYIAAAFALFWLHSVQIPIIWPTLSFLLIHTGAVMLRWLDALKSKQHIKSVFASYISPGVMNNILKDPESIKLGGERKPVTIFFSDIRGFTSFSEGANEVELVRQLNEYFEKMVGCVSRYEGTLHKYIGDAIMAVWGDVLNKGEACDAKNAVRCALAMKKELIQLNEYWKADGRIDLKIGIGLNHGPVCVGNIGATQRREFTVIGDAVNLASRLEGVTKVFHTDFCIGESVYNLLEGEFLVRTLSLLIVKGKTKPVRVYEVLDDLMGIEPMNFFSPQWVYRYETAFEHFINREFEMAAYLFGECLQEKSDDFMSAEYYRTALDCMENPPGLEWDGVIRLEIK